MRHKLCRSFHPWCPGVKNRCLSFLLGFLADDLPRRSPERASSGRSAAPASCVWRTPPCWRSPPCWPLPMTTTREVTFLAATFMPELLRMLLPTPFWDFLPLPGLAEQLALCLFPAASSHRPDAQTGDSFCLPWPISHRRRNRWFLRRFLSHR